MELEDLVARIPVGWTRVLFDGRAYGLTRTSRAGGDSVSVYAEELAGNDVVSANLYRTSAGLVLKPCEMPEETVRAFLRGWVAPPPAEVVETLRSAGCVFAEEEAALLLEAAGSPVELAELVRRRVSGLPLEQVLGWAEFCGLRLHVGPGVFVPRRRTEALAQEALRIARRVRGVPVVLDLCCGVGAIAAAVQAGLPDVELHACDIEPAAVACARTNLGSSAHVYEGDLDVPLPVGLAGRVDVLVANVPYVPTDEIDLLPAEARLHEPAVTLDGGSDGLRVLAKVADLAPRWLAPGGSVMCEVSQRQAEGAMDELRARGLRARAITDPELGATVVVGVRIPES